MSRGLQAEDTAPQRATPDPEHPVSTPADAMASVEDQRMTTGGYRVSLPMFEGPLDLLLHLVQKHELDILNIPIAFITERYVEYIQLLDVLNIDLASEYLVMAATLVHIKSRMLLPNAPDDESGDGTEEEELDPRAELVRRLLEYQKYKLAAEQLGGRAILGRDVFPRGSSDELAGGEAPLEVIASFKLLDAFQAVLERTKKTREHQIDFERFSLSDKIAELSEMLQSTRRLVFHELFREGSGRAELIITFLALLEMTRLRLTRLRQDGPLQPIYIELTVSDEEFPADGAGSEGALPVDTAAKTADDPIRVDAATEDLAADDLATDDLAAGDAITDVATTAAASADDGTPTELEADTLTDEIAADQVAADDLAADELAWLEAAGVGSAEDALLGAAAAAEAVTDDAPAVPVKQDAAPIEAAAEVAATETGAAELATEPAVPVEPAAAPADDALRLDIEADDVPTDASMEELAPPDVSMPTLPHAGTGAEDDVPTVAELVADEDAVPIGIAGEDPATSDMPPEDLEPSAGEPEPRPAADPREYE